MRIRVGLFLTLLLVAAKAFATETGDPAYLTELIHRSAEARLYEERLWHLLLHYRPNVWGGYTSEADDPGFFLAPEGKTDPQAELAATLTQFFSTDLVGRSRQPAQCAFVARYHWLKSRLLFDDRRLPPQRCDRFTAWLRALDPQSVSLIFPTAYLNNPASMFGHTLLRIDQKGQTEQTRILAYTINFAAEVPPDVGLELPLLGLTGGFKGSFSTLPYYLKVREYRDLENRDIWEYRLTLTEAEVERMLMHAWELGNTHFDYFFLKENCAYQILSLLEVARPELHLTDRFLFWTVPGDTVRAVTQQPGFVGEIAYRPSRATQIRRKRSALTEEERDWLVSLTRGASAVRSEAFSRLTPERQATVLEVASDYLLYKSLTDEAQAAVYKERNQSILAARSALKVKPVGFGNLKLSAFTAPPEQGHKTSRAGLGGGWREDEFFEELTVRAGYHDLLDPEPGYPPDAQIELLAVSLRRYERRDQVRLERLTLANLVSLSPMDSLFKSPSWKVSGGLQTVRRLDCRYCSNVNVNGGIGGALETSWLGREVYFAFAELDANYGRAYAQDHRVGGGGTIGLLATLTDRWKVMLTGSYLRYPLGERSDDTRASFQQRYTLNKDLTLRLEFNHRRDQDNEAVLAIQAFF